MDGRRSCPHKQLPARKGREEQTAPGKEGKVGRITRGPRGVAQYRGFENRFYWKAHLLGGPFPSLPARRSPRQEEFGGGVLLSSTKKVKQTMFSDFCNV